MSALTEQDAQLLRELLHEAPEDEDEAKWNVKAFREMFERGRALSDKQHAWLVSVYEKVTGNPVALNLWSSGKVPAGDYGKSEVPAVLKNLPKYPPGRGPKGAST